MITGATGFIGRAIVRRLAIDGHEAIPVGGDLLAETPDLSQTNATHCIHAAWYTNHTDYLGHPANRAWLAASTNLAEAFALAGGKRFIGLGTCLEYDVAHASGLCVEDETPLRPDSLYARCKLKLFQTLADSGRDFAWVRVFFVYGPHDRAGRLVPSMMNCFSRGEATGPTFGGLRRDYIHVDDLADQVVRIAISGVPGPINTGVGEAPKLSEIFAAGALAFGRPDLARTNNEIGGQPPVIAPDLTRFREKIGDPHARNIAAGLKDLIG